MTATATRVLENYVAGRWVPAEHATEILDVTNPATGWFSSGQGSGAYFVER